MKKLLLPVVVLLAVGGATLRAKDWPQYRGLTRDGTSPEKIARTWPPDGPKLVWRIPSGSGLGSWAVSGGRAFTLFARELDGVPQEVCAAFDARTGEELWATPVDVAKYDGGGDAGTDDNKGGDGPRSTPTVDGKRVYVSSARVKIHCLDARTGATIWRKDVLKDHNGRNISWQSGASPLIEGDLLFTYGGGPGESLLALHKKDGRVVWKGQDARMTHSTPVAVTIHGTRQVVFFTQEGLVSVVPKTGQVLWRQSYPFKVATAISPVVAGDLVYVSAAYGVGAGVFRISKQGKQWSASEVWRAPNRLLNHWSTPVVKDGFLYGLYGHAAHAQGPLVCVELATGRELWSRDGFGPGNVILADGHLLALSDKGELVLARATPAHCQEIARARLINGKCWSTPALADGKVYLRSTKEGACYDISPRIVPK